MQLGELEKQAFELNVSNANLMTENQLLMERIEFLEKVLAESENETSENSDNAMEVKIDSIKKLGDRVILELRVIHEEKVEKLHFVYETALE